MSTDPIPDMQALLSALIISLISGIISIGSRIGRGHPPNLLWVLCEFLTALLCGYLMFYSYPFLPEWTPAFITEPAAIAFAAHSGGRIFQEFENKLIDNLSILTRRPK